MCGFGQISAWWLSLHTEIQAALIGVVGALIGGLVGGALTGWFTVLATNRAHRQTLERDRISMEQQVIAFVQAIQAEIESSLVSLREIIRVIPTLDGTKALEGIFPANRISFEVFEASAQLLGAVDDRDLRKTIVKTYAAMRAFVDTIEYNNGLATEHQEAIRKGSILALSHGASFEADIAHRILVSYAGGIVRYWQDLDSNLCQFWERSNAWLRAKGAQENPPPELILAEGFVSPS
jgi:hypothetical protein